MTRQAGDFVHFFVERDAFLQVLELRRAADFGKDGERVRIPLDHDLALLHCVTVVDFELGAVNYGVALTLAVFLVNDCNRTLTVHHYQIARLRLNSLQSDEADRAGILGIETRLLGDSRRRTTNVEGAHRELRSGLADRLRSDDAGGFAEFYENSRRQVAAVTHHADAALRFAGEHRTNLHAFDSGCLNRSSKFFCDLVIDVDNHVAVVVFDLLKRYSSHNAVAQRFDNFAGFDDTLDVNAVHGAAIVFADDHVLRHVNETASEVAGIGRLERRVG